MGSAVQMSSFTRVSLLSVTLILFLKAVKLLKLKILRFLGFTGLLLQWHITAIQIIILIRMYKKSRISRRRPKLFSMKSI